MTPKCCMRHPCTLGRHRQESQQTKEAAAQGPAYQQPLLPAAKTATAVQESKKQDAALLPLHLKRGACNSMLQTDVIKAPTRECYGPVGRPCMAMGRGTTKQDPKNNAPNGRCNANRQSHQEWHATSVSSSMGTMHWPELVCGVQATKCRVSTSCTSATATGHNGVHLCHRLLPHTNTLE